MPEKSRAGKKTEVVTTEVEVVNNKVDKKYMMALTGLCNIETKIVTCFGAVKNILFKRCFH